MSDWAKELLADVARDISSALYHECKESDVKFFVPVLERRLLPLLEAGEALQDALYDSYHTGKHAEKCDNCKAYVAWDAAKAEAAKGAKP